LDRNLAVLVVDDDESSREFQRDVLGGEGYQVRVAPGGTEALQMLAGDAFDLVLLDVRMPGVDAGGAQALREQGGLRPWWS
jgi:two-component system phosphate regulon response regulator OmpR